MFVRVGSTRSIVDIPRKFVRVGSIRYTEGILHRFCPGVILKICRAVDMLPQHIIGAAMGSRLSTALKMAT